MTTRREFIRKAIWTGASLALVSSSGCQPTSSDKRAIDDKAFRKFQSSLAGKLLRPGDMDYETARRVASWNPSIDKHPLLIARCSHEDDVARSLEFARQNGLLTAVRSGGHSFLGWGTCDDGMVIDLSMMTDIQIDPDKHTARVGAGTRAQDLVHAAAAHGLAPVLGECGAVGIAGLTLGGGLGWLSSTYGSASDNLLSASMMSVDSKSMAINATSNPALFWAIRGGGGNFGIVTSFELQLHPVREVLAGGFTYPLSEARNVLRFYRDFMATAPDELQALAYLFPLGNGVVNVIVVCQGDLKQAESIIKPFTKIATPLRNTVQPRPYAETFTMPPYGEFPPSVYGTTKGTYIESLSDNVIDLAIAAFGKTPPGFCAIGFDHYMHGKVCRIAPDATAFSLRASGGLHTWIGMGWDDPSAATASMKFVDETWKSLQPFTGGRMYSNYQSVVNDNSAREVFGTNLERLATIKKKFDPENFLRLNQNILVRSL